MAGFYRTCVIDQVIAASPADYVRRPNVPAESPTLGLSHLQFEALLSASRLSVNVNDFALVVMLGLLGLRIFEACGANIEDLGEEHGHRVLRVHGKVVLTPLAPTVQRAIERAVAGRAEGPILLNRRGSQISARHADPRTTMRYDRARKNLDRHPNQLHPRRLHGLRHLTTELFRACIFRYTIFAC